MEKENKHLIIIPTYNELGNIEKLTREVFEIDHPFEILVVDDGSPDGTGVKVKELQKEFDGRLHILEREGKNGLGSAYRAGFRYALEKGYDSIQQMDADFSHDPKYLLEFQKELETNDIVLGSRYKDGKISVVNWDWKRLLLSYCANIYARLVTGLPVRDATGGFKCFRRSALLELDLDRVKSDGYSFQIETSFRLWKKGKSIEEIPIVFADRTVGESKLSGQIIGEALFVLIKLRLGK
jgi:dolichol-phosphate mannosyltransferase